MFSFLFQIEFNIFGRISALKQQEDTKHLSRREDSRERPAEYELTPAASGQPVFVGCHLSPLFSAIYSVQWHCHFSSMYASQETHQQLPKTSLFLVWFPI